MLKSTLFMSLALISSATQAGQPVPPKVTQAPPPAITPASIVAALRSDDFVARASAARTVAERPALQQDASVKAAVVMTLKEQSNAMTAHYAAIRQGTFVETRSPDAAEAEGEALLALTAAAAKLETPDLLAALLPVVASGSTAQNRIAKYGVVAIDNLIEVYRSGVGAGQDSLMRFGALRTLAMIARASKLTEAQRDQLSAVAREATRSSTTQVVAGGLDLGVAIFEPAILAQARELSTRTISGTTRQDLDQRFLKEVCIQALALAGVR